MGMLPVAVFQEGDRITNILAPDITYNEISGVGGKFRMRRYFSRDSNLVLDAGTSTEGDDDYEVIYNQRRVGPNRLLYYQARFAYRTRLSERFFGIGNDSDEVDELARQIAAEFCRKVAAHPTRWGNGRGNWPGMYSFGSNHIHMGKATAATPESLIRAAVSRVTPYPPVRTVAIIPRASMARVSSGQSDLRVGSPPTRATSPMPRLDLPHSTVPPMRR